jgi:hypothetical protein
MTVASDTEAEQVAVELAGEQDVQLRTGYDEDAVAVRHLGAVPVVGDREHVVAGTGVVLGKLARRQVAVGLRRVRVQRAAHPGSGLVPGARKRGHGRPR